MDRFSWALSSRPKIPEIPGGGANEKDIFRNIISEFWVYLARLSQYSGKYRYQSGKFCSIRPFLLGPSFSEASIDLRSTNSVNMAATQQFQCSPCLLMADCFVGGISPHSDPLPSGILPVGMTTRVNSSQVSLVIRK